MTESNPDSLMRDLPEIATIGSEGLVKVSESAAIEAHRRTKRQFGCGIRLRECAVTTL